MKKVSLTPSVVALGALLLAACQDTTQPSNDGDLTLGLVVGDQIPGSYIVVFNDDAGRVPDVAAELAGLHGAAVGRVFQTAIRGFSGPMSAQAAANIATDPRVSFVEQDQVVGLIQQQGRGTLAKPDNPGNGNGNSGGGDDDSCADHPLQETPPGIGRVNGGSSDATSTAWILDTGVDLNHCDLNVDQGRSATFITAKNASPDDQHGHGTHVAGTVAAVNNGIGVIGVAAGATVVSVRVLDRRGSGTVSGVIAGIDYVAANAVPGDVANMSLGGGASTALDDAVINAAILGTRFALAAGNSGAHAGNYSPARANHGNIWTVSAVNSADVFASFSNYGNPPVDVAAPGVSIYSLWKNNGYNTISGTSMAAPHVAGVLLLGAVSGCGSAIGDPDGNADPIACH